MPDLAARTVDMACRILVICALFYSSARTFVDRDLWWHLRCGIDVVQTGKVSDKDTYSFLTHDQRFFNHEWLSDAIFAFIYLNFGWAGLVVFKCLLVLAILALAYRAISKWKLDLFGNALFLLMTAVFLAPATNTIRPHLFSCLLMSILLITIRGARQNVPWGFWLLPPIFVLWINLHGGFIVGLATFLFWTFLELCRFIRYRQGTYIYYYLLTCALCGAAILVNPYGIDLPAFIFQVSILPRPEQLEWKPIELLQNVGPLWAIVTAGTLVALGMSRERPSFSRTGVWLGFAAAPLISVRHVQFFGMATVYLVGEQLASLWRIWTEGRGSKAKARWGISTILFIVTCAIISVWLAASSLTFFRAAAIAPGIDMPTEAVSLLKEAGAQGNMLVDLDWGGFVSWYLAPAVKVSYDTRQEFTYSPAATLANNLFTSGTGPWDFLLEKFPIDMVLIKRQSPTYNLMKQKTRWELAFENEISALFLSRDSKQAQRVKEILHSTPQDKLVLPSL